MIDISSKRLFYRYLTEEDATELYIKWLNDPDVNRYTESRYSQHTIESCKKFIKEMNLARDQHLFGIFLRSNDCHIGNIKLGFVNNNHASAQLGIIIGEKNLWGNGFATESIKRITTWGFDSLRLKKLEAGCYETNLASLKAFLSVGYQVEGFLRSHSILEDIRVGSFLLGILPHEIR